MVAALLTPAAASISLPFSSSLLGGVEGELFSTLPKCFRSRDCRTDAFRNEKIYCSKRKVVEEHRLAMAMSNFGKQASIRKSVSDTDMVVYAEQHEVTCCLSSLLPCVGA